MDLRFTPEENAFRDEVRTFLRAALPESIRRKMAEGRRLVKEDIVTWQRILNKPRAGRCRTGRRSGAAPAGARCSTTSSSEELQQAPAPEPLPFGVNMVGPVIIAFGSEAQKQTLPAAHRQSRRLVVPGLLRAGRGLRPRLAQDQRRKREGDHYVVNGQKTWTTLRAIRRLDLLPCAHRSRRPRSRKASSFLLIDMKTPGITVRPIQTIDGGHEVNEVFFDDVRVPVENRVGEENKGWDYAKFLLGNERSGIARVGVSKAQVAAAAGRSPALERVGDKPLIEDERFAHEDRGDRGRAEGAGNDAASRRRRRAQPQGQPARSRPPRS